MVGEMPQVDHAMPMGGQRGKEVEVRLSGVNLSNIEGVVLGGGLVSAQILSCSARSATIRLKIPESASTGVYRLHVAGATLPVPFVISDSPEVTLSSHAGRNKQGALPVALPVIANGVLDTPKLAHYFSFRIEEPQTLLLAADSMQLGFMLDPMVTIYDESGQRIAYQDEPTSNTDTFESIDSYYRNALELMRSPRAKKAFDIAQESEPLRERYGRTGLGQGCLLARRLVEAGVRFVTVSSGNWDHHTSVFTNLANEFLPELDRAFATLLEDLTARGMLETTIVLVTGEFGRTPEINVYAGRDHWPNCFSLAIAGGGIQGGRVWGASDQDGMFVKDNPVEVQNFVATIYHKLGIDYTKEYVSNIGRPIKLAGDGEPLHFL